jgi:hypothetical protein
MERLAQVIWTARDDSANLRTAKACSRVTPGNHSRNWSTVAPPSRFSKSACTGTRVPLNTQAPLTLPGTPRPPHTLSNPTCFANYALTRTRASGKLASGHRAVRQALSSSRASRLGDVEMGPLRQPAGNCGNNLSSVCARSSPSLAQEVRLTCKSGWAHFGARDASGKRGNTPATVRFGQGQKASGSAHHGA